MCTGVGLEQGQRYGQGMDDKGCCCLLRAEGCVPDSKSLIICMPCVLFTFPSVPAVRYQVNTASTKPHKFGNKGPKA